MTEQQWLNCTDPTPMLRFLENRCRPCSSDTQISEQWDEDDGRIFEIPELLKRESASRKVWLFCCACARRGEYLGDALCAEDRRRGIKATEDFLDGKISRDEWDSASAAGLNAHYDAASTVAAHLFYGWRTSFAAAIDAADSIAREFWTHPLGVTYEDHFREFPLEEQAAKRAAENNRRLGLSVLVRCIFGNPFRPVAFDPARRTPNVTAVAQAVYEERRFADLPILADALEEAGCTSAELLAHCRGGGDHVRGCWALDLALGKQ